VTAGRLPVGVRRRGGTYQVRWRDDSGAQRALTFATREEAVAKRADIDSNRARRRLAPAESQMHFGAWAGWWLDQTAMVDRPATAARDRSILRAHLLPAFGEMRLCDVTMTGVQEWVRRLTAAGSAPATVRRTVQTLSKLLGAAVDFGQIDRNPCQGVKLPSVGRTEARFLTPGEVLALAGAMETLAPHWSPLVLFLADTALRIGELAGLRVADVDLGTGTVTVARNAVEVEGHIAIGEPKTAAGRRVVPTLTDDTARALAVRVGRLGLGAHDPLFAGPDGGILRASTFRARVWYPAVVRAGLSVPRPTPHSLRHSAIAAWIAVGVVDPLKLARWADHRDVSTIYRFYGHLLPCDGAAERAALAELRHAARRGSALRHELVMPRELAEGG